MKIKILLALIVFLGFSLRIWHVSSLPSILNRDEAALAYNALLLKESGKDEWERSWPIALESFGDFKLIGYPIAIIPFFALFDYNDISVRLPSVIAGTVLIFLSFIFAKQYKLSDNLSLLFSFIISITPIFWFYSRMAYEANLALTYFVGAIIIILLESQGKKKVFLDMLAVFLVLLSVFTYNTPFLLLPFIIIAIPFIRGVKNIKNWLVIVVGLSAVFLIAASILVPLSSQKSGITIFSDETVWTDSVTYREQFSGVSQKLLGNKYVYYSILASDNLVNSFSPNFMVQNGGTHPWHSLPSHGHIYWSVYIAGFASIIMLLFAQIKLIFNAIFKKDDDWREKINIKNIFLLYLLFISLLPSIVTVDSPHATRSLLFFYVFSFFAVLGVEGFLEYLNGNKKSR